jgi:sugar transferase (PEP-CTERM/EpsH1 system associated)
VSFAIYRSRELAAWMSAVIAAERPVAMIVHSSSVATYGVDIVQPGSSKPWTVLHFADVDSEKFLAYSRRTSGFRSWFYRLEGRRVRREEKRLARRADRITLVSATEVALFQSVVWDAPDRVATLPNGVDLSLFRRDAYPEPPFDKSGPTLMFSGAMDYAPNVDAVVWFAESVFPSVRRELPSAQFVIVGSKPAGAVRQLVSHPGVQVTGRVRSVAEYLAHADVAVAPLRIARGVQNKVLEAMAMGLPTIVSPETLGGLTATPDVHLRVARTAGEWREACLHLLRRPVEARELGNAARRHVEADYSWETQFERLDRLLAGDRIQHDPA